MSEAAKDAFAAGTRLLSEGDAEGALAAFVRAARDLPDDAAVLASLATAAIRLGRHTEAEAALRAVPWPSPRLKALLGMTLQNQERWDEAEAVFREAVAMAPDGPEGLLGLAITLVKLVRMEEAESVLRHLLDVVPNSSHGWVNLASVHRYHERLSDAFAAYARGLELMDPNDSLAVVSHCEMALTALGLGDLATGFAEYEWRLKGAVKDKADQMAALAPAWDGRVVRGRRLLLWYEQGLGDTIQFLRYAVRLAEWGMDVRVLVQPALARLARSLPLSEVGVAGERVPACDCQAALMSVPHLLHKAGRGVVVPRDIPYLRPDEAEARAWRDKVARQAGGRPAVGVVWCGNPHFPQDHRRSIPFGQMRPLLEVDGVAMFSLQIGLAAPPSAEMTELGVIDLTAEVGDYADTAALMSAMDLVVSVDTSTIHCAGALGRPAWLLLPRRPDWRWGTVGERCLWYPTVRVFRQETPDDWKGVVARAASALKALYPSR